MRRPGGAAVQMDPVTLAAGVQSGIAFVHDGRRVR
jgi:hypothetical protein